MSQNSSPISPNVQSESDTLKSKFPVSLLRLNSAKPEVWLGLFCGLVALMLIGTTIAGLVLSYSPFPTGDSRSIVGFMDKTSHNVSLYDYILQEHNEHRIFLTKVFMLLVYYFLDGQKLFLIGLLHLVNAAVFCICFQIFRKERGSGFLFFLLLFPFFSLVQYKNFDSAFQLQFHFVNLFASLAFWSFEQSIFRHDSRIRFLIICVLCAAAAAFNMTNGLFVVFALVCLALTNPTRIRLGVLFFAFVGIWSLYFFRYDSFGDSDPFSLSLESLKQLVLYSALFVGNIFNLHSKSHIESYFPGGIGLILGLWVLLQQLFSRVRKRGDLAAAGIILFVFASVFAAAYGRMEKGGPEQALTGRYSSTSVIYWAAIIGFYWRATESNKTIIRKFRWVFIAFSVVSVGILSIRQMMMFCRLFEVAEERAIAEVAILSGVYDKNYIHQAFPYYKWKTYEQMQLRGMIPFQGAEYPEIGKKLCQSIDESNVHKCLSVIAVEKRDFAEPNEAGYMIIGNSSIALDGKRFALVDPWNQIVGYATRIRDCAKLLPGWEKDDSENHWVGYTGLHCKRPDLLSLMPMNESYPKSGPSELYSVSWDTLKLSLYTLIEFGEDREVEIPEFESICEKSESFTRNGYYSGIYAEKPFKVFGTWSEFGKERNTGSIRFKITFDASDKKRFEESLLVPFVLGPNRDGIRILVKNHSRDTVYQLPIKDLITHHWYFLDVKNAVSLDGVEIEVQDTSGEWGEWIAVGEPFFIEDPEGDSFSIQAKSLNIKK